MQAVAQYIFLFLVGTTVLNLLIAIAARMKTRHREFNYMIAYWVSLFVNFIAVAFLSHTETELAFAFFFQFIPNSIIARILRDSRGLPSNWAVNCALYAVGAIVSAILILETHVGFTISLLPVTIVTVLPFLSPMWNALVSARKESNWIEKAMGILFVTGVIHSFNYAFFRLEESSVLWGWSIGIAQYQCLSIFLPLLINFEREQKERRNIGHALERVSGNHVITPYTEVDELYHSLEVQLSLREDYSRQLTEMNRHLQEEREINEILIKTISHDLANPLTVINAYMDMMSTGKISPEDHEKFQDRMRMNLKSAMDMIQRIRKTVLTRSEADLLKVGPVDLKIALERVKHLFEDRLAHKKLRLRMSSIDGNLMVIADENGLVEHVFANLLSNAVKFSYENSDILIDVRTDNDKVRVEVRDYGTGMNPARRDKMRFISTPGTRGEEGSGFGLMVMGYFIRKFGAQLEMISHVDKGGRGTSFIVSLKRVITDENPTPITDKSTSL
jgi:signal transduction histidine kinase